jgi:hypothetical protein
MELKKLSIISCLTVLATALPAVAQQVSFDYSKTSAETTVAYDKGLKVVLENVNTLDYTYEISVQAVLPQPPAPPALPAPGSMGLAPAPNAALNMCKDLINASLLERLARFGSESLLLWKTTELDGLEAKGCSDAAARSQIQAVLGKAFQSAQPGQTPVLSAKLAAELADTGPGGKLIITVEATPKLTQIAGDTAAALGAVKVEGAALDMVLLSNTTVKSKVDQHKKARTFTVNFEPPEGILFSFGPYLSQLGRKEFERVANPDHDPMDENSNEFMIGLAEDSDQSFGVAAYWSVVVWQWDKFGLGFSWGVAYDVQNEIDEAVQGLVSVAFEFQKTPLLLHVGAAVGRQKRLADGFELMDPIGANQEIPATTSTEVELYVGISFRFGRR